MQIECVMQDPPDLNSIQKFPAKNKRVVRRPKINAEDKLTLIPGQIHFRFETILAMFERLPGVNHPLSASASFLRASDGMSYCGRLPLIAETENIGDRHVVSLGPCIDLRNVDIRAAEMFRPLSRKGWLFSGANKHMPEKPGEVGLFEALKNN